MGDKVLVAVASALCGAVLTWALKAAAIEGRLDALQASVARIENRLFPVTTP